MHSTATNFAIHNALTSHCGNKISLTKSGSCALYTTTTTIAIIQSVHVSGMGAKNILELGWSDGGKSLFPGVWLRGWAGEAGKRGRVKKKGVRFGDGEGWEADGLEVPGFKWGDLNGEGVRMKVYDALLMDSGPGIVRISDAPGFEGGNGSENESLVTKVMKEIFGSTFEAPQNSTNETTDLHDPFKSPSENEVQLPHTSSSQHLYPPASRPAPHSRPKAPTPLYPVPPSSPPLKKNLLTSSPISLPSPSQ
ncbi:hypothetical protein BPAE_0026g00390 [Botrytis paeoniae]|uniref:Uncharacterized protein n=1 Tax=Botrytis paeoniae TaxID=278948 RepID=A0A4Z1G0H6_9HELO|nr:hypothetical protein BPAE_0026g00390 [Botrytis paeoniae]